MHVHVACLWGLFVTLLGPERVCWSAEQRPSHRCEFAQTKAVGQGESYHVNRGSPGLPALSSLMTLSGVGPAHQEREGCQLCSSKAVPGVALLCRQRARADPCTSWWAWVKVCHASAGGRSCDCQATDAACRRCQQAWRQGQKGGGRTCETPDTA